MEVKVRYDFKNTRSWQSENTYIPQMGRIARREEAKGKGGKVLKHGRSGWLGVVCSYKTSLLSPR